ncbi:hypothetical protein V6N13_105827 [Hibiscus sabdariffa]|uniref:WAT1-related protein n=1 Tax=Hibiscus sabdariffa TaxID=183260 RepID=A0ABR2EYW0_9ROSI
MSEKYPCYYSSTALTCLFGAVQSVVYALCVERDMSRWKLGWNIRLLTVAYLIKGFYTSVFNPLALVLVAIAGSLFLEEKLYLGTIIGSVLIVVGLYVVLWGKGKEMKKKVSQLVPMISSPENKGVEVVVTSSLDDNTSTISNDNRVFVLKIHA